MADQWEITYENNKTGKRGTCTKEEWDVLRRHPMLKGTNRLIKKTQIFTPNAAIEAEQAKAEEAVKASSSAPNKKKRSGRTPKTESQNASSIKNNTEAEK